MFYFFFFLQTFFRGLLKRNAKVTGLFTEEKNAKRMIKSAEARNWPHMFDFNLIQQSAMQHRDGQAQLKI